MQFKTAQTTPHDYRLVENASQLREVVAEVGKYGEFCFDTETTGFDIFNDRIVGMSLAVKPFEAWYIPFKEENTAEYTQIVRPLFEDEGIAKIGQNIKFDLMVLRRLGLDIRGRKYDTMILHYLLDPESRHNMNALSEKYLNYKPIEIETLIGKGSKQLTMDLVNVERVKEYAAEDADVTLQLKHVLYPQVEKIGLQHLYFEVEEPMIAVLADIEMAGVRIDSGALTEYSVELSRRLAELEAQIRTEAGESTLNINSARQLGEVLFAKMRIAEKPKMTKTKQFCTKLFNKTLGEVTSEERRRAKTANFGIIYGISAFGLSQRLEIPRKEAKDIIDGYFESYPKVKEYMDDVVAKAKEEGFVSTIFGRRRYLNDISSHNAVARGLAERNAVNAPIQGSAADIMKIAMINVHRRFAAEGIRSKVILQVHDELVVDMLRSEQERVAAIVTECMESAAALKVRLVVDYGVGDNWLEAH